MQLKSTKYWTVLTVNVCITVIIFDPLATFTTGV